LHAGADTRAITAHIAAAIAAGKPAWVVSNHDFRRLGNRVGERNLRAMTLLLFSLPGPTFMFQGDELGMLDAPTSGPQLDRAGRDPFRHPLPWDQTPATAGFTTGTAWLPVGDGTTTSVAEQEHEPGSHLQLTRRLIALKAELRGELNFVQPAAPGTVAFTRGPHLVAVNFGDDPSPAPTPSQATQDLMVEVEARPGDGAHPGVIPPHGAWIARLRRE
jgi:alpha-glucosidase